MDLTKNIELESIARSAMLALFDGLNDSITTMNALWEDRDDLFYARINRDDPKVSVETIAVDNFYVGHVPSLIQAPLDKYPNCAVLAVQGDSVNSSSDWAETYGVTLWVELMCKSVDSEEEVNSRLLRTMEAAHSVMMSGDNRRLGGMVSSISNTPSVTVGDVFVRRESHGHGDRWFWQGARLAYQVQKELLY